ncbi:helix-turn-helix transcriptional regulator [Microbacterium esteraromaticum]|uniref:helix-turn-helix transcriptional regulator n=1 Tax=Microbacterium esteraromaticum TaxID=57043 RepID=UPI002368031E|nr:helix-turn-helix transcriptional regulator [Microbacterium esteraromaticum]WDH77871.1 helix-turn-helix transcriptional regulator [Microbacterium esteraromaticum]
MSSSTGPALRVLREDAGLTAREVAGRAGVSESYLSRVENGKAYPAPSWVANVAAAIAEAIAESARRSLPDQHHVPERAA